MELSAKDSKRRPSGFVAVQLPPAASPAAPLPASQVDGGGSQEDEGSVAGSGASSTGSSSAAPAALEISHVCATCRRLKIACEGEFPCQRCFRLSLPCRPQLPRARKGPKRRMTPEEEEREERARERQEEAAKALPMMDLCFQRNNPQMHTLAYLEAFHQLYDEGLVCRLKTINALRHWHWLSEVAGSDVSLGMGAVIARKLDIGALDLECEDSLVLDPGAGSEAARRERRLAVEREARARAEALKAQPLFRLEDSGGEDCVHMLIVDRVLMQATNEGFERVFRGALDLTGDVMRKRALLALLFASAVEKEDRLIWFRCVVGTMFCSMVATSSQFIRCFTRSGDVVLYLLQSKSLRVDLELDSEGGGGGGSGNGGGGGGGFSRVAHITKFSPVPLSRHVTVRPGHMRLARLFVRGDSCSSSSSRCLSPSRTQSQAEGEMGHKIDISTARAAQPEAQRLAPLQEEEEVEQQEEEEEEQQQQQQQQQEEEGPRLHFPHIAALPLVRIPPAEAATLLDDAAHLAAGILVEGSQPALAREAAEKRAPAPAPVQPPGSSSVPAAWNPLEGVGAPRMPAAAAEERAPPSASAVVPQKRLRSFGSAEPPALDDDGDSRVAWASLLLGAGVGQEEEDGQVPCFNDSMMEDVFEGSPAAETGWDQPSSWNAL